MTGSIFEIHTRAEALLLRLFGFVDAGTVQKIKPAIKKEIADPWNNLVVDLKNVGFLDSHGVGLFVTLLRQAHHNKGRIIFAAANGQPATILHMVGLNGARITHCTTLKEALSLCACEKRRASM